MADQTSTKSSVEVNGETPVTSANKAQAESAAVASTPVVSSGNESSNGATGSSSAKEDSSVVDASQTATGAANPDLPKLVGEELKKALVQQIELIFLRENLQSNYGIVSQMNGDLYVLISIVCEYLSSMTTDQSAVLDALLATDKVVVSEDRTMVKPAFKLERNTIILRDVPAEVTEEEIKALFDDEKVSSQITEVRQDIGNCWFVTFKSEDITTDAFFPLRAKQLRGKPVQARVKSENLLKSTYTPSYYAQAGYYKGGNYYTNNNNNNYDSRSGQYYGRNGNSGQGSYRGGSGSSYKQDEYSSSYRKGGRGGYRKTTQPRPPTGAPAATNTREFNNTRKGANATAPATALANGQAAQQQGAKRTTTRGARNGAANTAVPAAAPATSTAATATNTTAAAQPQAHIQRRNSRGSVPLGLTHFPPLASAAAANLTKFSKDQILHVLAASNPKETGIVVASSEVTSATPITELELTKPLPAGAKVELVEIKVQRRRSSSASSQGRSGSTPRSRPEHPLTAAQVAAAEPKRPPLPLPAAKKVAAVPRKPQAPVAAPKQQEKKKEEPATEEKKSDAATPANTSGPKPTAWADIARAAQPAGEKKDEKKAPTPVKKPAAASPTKTSPNAQSKSPRKPIAVKDAAVATPAAPAAPAAAAPTPAN